MRRLWSGWVALLERRETGESQALFRIGVGLTVFVNVLWTVAAGVVPVAWIDVDHGGYLDLGQGGGWLLDLLGGATPTHVWTLVAVTLVASAALTLGLGARAAAFVAGQGLLALSATNPHARGSYDALLSNALWLLVLADSGATWSLQAKLRSGAWRSDRRIAAWPRYLAIVQLAVMYLMTGAHKMSADWLPGGELSALYYVLQMPNWHRVDMRWLASVYPLTQVGTLLSWLWEWSAPLLLVDAAVRDRAARRPLGRVGRLWRRLRFRAVFVALGVLFHLGVIVSMDVGVFAFAAWALYPCLFSGAEVRAATARNGEKTTSSSHSASFARSDLSVGES